jgi:hypothetical protein
MGSGQSVLLKEWKVFITGKQVKLGTKESKNAAVFQI